MAAAGESVRPGVLLRHGAVLRRAAESRRVGGRARLPVRPPPGFRGPQPHGDPRRRPPVGPPQPRPLLGVGVRRRARLRRSTDRLDPAGQDAASPLSGKPAKRSPAGAASVRLVMPTRPRRARAHAVAWTKWKGKQHAPFRDENERRCRASDDVQPATHPVESDDQARERIAAGATRGRSRRSRIGASTSRPIGSRARMRRPCRRSRPDARRRSSRAVPDT